MYKRNSNSTASLKKKAHGHGHGHGGHAEYRDNHSVSMSKLTRGFSSEDIKNMKISQERMMALPNLVYSGWTGGDKQFLQHSRDHYFADVIH